MCYLPYIHTTRLRSMGEGNVFTLFVSSIWGGASAHQSLVCGPRSFLGGRDEGCPALVSGPRYFPEEGRWWVPQSGPRIGHPPLLFPPAQWPGVRTRAGVSPSRTRTEVLSNQDHNRGTTIPARTRTGVPPFLLQDTPWMGEGDGGTPSCVFTH